MNKPVSSELLIELLEQEAYLRIKEAEARIKQLKASTDYYRSANLKILEDKHDSHIFNNTNEGFRCQTSSYNPHGF